MLIIGNSVKLYSCYIAASNRSNAIARLVMNAVMAALRSSVLRCVKIPQGRGMNFGSRHGEQKDMIKQEQKHSTYLVKYSRQNYTLYILLLRSLRFLRIRLYQLLLYPVECKVSRVLDRLVVQVGQYRHNSKTRCGRSPSLYPRVSCVHEEFLRLLDSRVDRERRQRPETRQIEYVEREGKKKRGDKNSHRCNRLEYSTLDGYHADSSRFGEVCGLQWRRASMISLVRLIPDIPIARTQLYELPCDPRINGHYSPSEIQPRNAIRRGNYSRRNDRPEGLTNITGLRVNLSLPNVCMI